MREFNLPLTKDDRFFNEVYESIQSFWDNYMTCDYLKVSNIRYIDGWTLVEVYDNNHWNEVIAIDGEHTLSEVVLGGIRNK